MLRNYLKIAIRNILRHKVFSLINILGLAVGMAVCIIIVQYVSYEYSYDKFNPDYENIYRVAFYIFHNNELKVKCAAAVPAVGPALKDNFPEVLDYCRAFPASGIMTYEDRSFREEKIQVVNPSFPKMMAFPLVQGDIETALDGPYKAVLTESAAERYFGTEDPIGKVITWDGEVDFEITGVCIDVPENSHIKFTFLVSHDTIREFWGEDVDTAWGWYDYNTYIQLAPGTDYREIDRKFADWLQAEFGERWLERNRYYEFPLQPLASIHLYSDLLQESEPDENGDGSAVKFLTLIAFFILVIAWVNYINLSTSKAMERAREVGIRKVSGAFRSELIRQFLFESVIINLLAILVSLLLVEISLPYFKQLTGSGMSASYLMSSGLWIWLILALVSGSFLSGLYPAFVMSSYRPVQVLKSSIMRSASGNLLRKILVVFQFTVSIALISGILIITSQLNFMRNRDLGIDLDQTFVLKGPGVFASDSVRTSTISVFRQEMENIPGIKSFTAATNVPGVEIFWGQGSFSEDQTKNDAQVMYLVGIDEHFIGSFDLKLVAGTNFTPGYRENMKEAIINMAAVRRYGYGKPDEIIGKKIYISRDTLVVKGVIANFNQMSLKNSIIPLAFPYLDNSDNFFALKIAADNAEDTTARIRRAWDDIFPGNPFDFFYLDEHFDHQYRKDMQFGYVFGIFSFLAIIIACLGLFALASFSTIKRTKEIGIRKVMGASINNIVGLLTIDFIKLVLLAVVIAVPLAYYIMNNWLQGFAYRVKISVWIFIISALMVNLIALVTIGYQTVKTARSNPVKALKYE